MIREVKEETNLDISHLTFCGIRDWYDKTTNERTIVFMFRTKTYKGILETDNVEGKVEWRKLDSIKPEEYASGLDKEMAIFFDNQTLEFYSNYNLETNKWTLKKY